MKSKLQKQREVMERIKRPQIPGVSAEFAVTPEEALAGFYRKGEGRKRKAKTAKKGKGKKRGVWCVPGCFEQGKRR
ncbi:hypothetical protein [Pseudomonas sp. PDM13]|uniref:hypothetical protein n=1 Tax=Pseudomonas sp. PDM13 TaxID=2769255 RepID=UPI0021E0B720|nr:hypothetical protein [Pseudomonas sp. PDM13]MCU9947548.1 hypothetical protein [Pseudomonas sp. PDM13]